MHNNMDYEIKLKNAAGVPILQIGGTITKAALNAVKITLDRLASAGHYNIIINIEKVQSSNWDFLSSLTGSIDKIREHYGSVDLVAGQEKIQQLLGMDTISRMFRLAKSEGQAILRIKRLSRLPESTLDINARVMESI